MKSTIITIIGLFAVASAGYAQQINGKILLNNRPQNTIELKTPEAVGLCAQLRENEITVNFIFEGSQLPKTASGKEVALIQFRTTVKHNGKEIASIKRSPMPFFPGDMLMPVETFDVISILLSGVDKQGAQANAKLARGKYEVVLEAIPTGVKGEVKPASLFFEVR